MKLESSGLRATCPQYARDTIASLGTELSRPDTKFCSDQ